MKIEAMQNTRNNATEALHKRERELVAAADELLKLKEACCSMRGMDSIDQLVDDIRTEVVELRKNILLAEAEAEVSFVSKIRGELGL